MGIINSRISSSQHITNTKKKWLSSDTQVLALPATAGLVLVALSPPWPSTGTDPSCAATESTLSTAFARRRGPLRLTLRPMPTMAMVDMVLATEAMAMVVSATAMADMALAMEDTVMEALATATARGLPILRLMPTTAMADTALAMEAIAMAVLATATARGLLTLRLMPITAMAVMVDTVLATAMARGLLMPTTAMVDTVLAMEATATAVSATAMASKSSLKTQD